MDVLDAAHAIVESDSRPCLSLPHRQGSMQPMLKTSLLGGVYPVQAQIAEALRPFLEPIGDRLDTANRHKWADIQRTRYAPGRAKPGRAEQTWLLSRVLAHRPDLTAVVQELCDRYELDFGRADSDEQDRVSLGAGRGWGPAGGLRADGVSGADLPDVIDRTDFAGFARAAYWSDDASQALLTEVAGTWFAKSTSRPRSRYRSIGPNTVSGSRSWSTNAARGPGRRRGGRAQARVPRAALEQAGAELGMGRKLHLPPPDPNLAVGPLALAAFGRDRPQAQASGRPRTLRDDCHLLSPPKPGDAASILRYTGWGGLSLEAAKTYLPPALVPDDKALIHEYYTPTKVASELARLLLPRIPHLPRHSSGDVLALEPSAGIGRLLNAASTPGFEALSWTALEYSPLAAKRCFGGRGPS